MYCLNKNNNYHVIASATTATILTLAIIFSSSMITIPVQASPVDGNSTTTTTATTTTAPSSSGLELSAQPVWDEQATTTGVTQINETHSIVTFIGNGTMTVSDTGETVNMTNNGTAFISPVPGYTSTVSAYGREQVFSEDGDTSAITFYEIVRYDPNTFVGSGLVIAVFDNNATGSLAPFNGMIVVGTHEEDPTAQTATIRLWEWESGIGRNAGVDAPPVQGESPMNITTTTNATAADTNATAADEGGGGEREEQQQQTTPIIAPTPLLE